MEERKILVARTAGFCFGVKRAVEKVYEQVNMGKQNIYACADSYSVTGPY